MEEIIFGDSYIKLSPEVRLKEERLKDLGSKYVEAEAKFQHFKDTLAYIKESILAELPEEPAEHTLGLEDGRTMIVRIPEKWSWDKKRLKDIYDSTATPECVNTSFTVDRKKFEAAPEEVRNVLAEALTIECGTATIKVS